MVELMVVSGGREPSLIVRKHVDSTRLEQQVRWLTRAHGPGIVRLHGIDRTAGHYSTCFAGPLTLATAASDPQTTVAILDGVWEVLGRLHRLGLVHGSVSAEHVVVSRRGPVLLSPGDPYPIDRRRDIADFGQMIADLSDVWSATAAVADPLINRWAGTGRAITDLGQRSTSGRGDQFVSAAEVRRLLHNLHGSRGSTPRFAGAWFRRWRSGR